MKEGETSLRNALLPKREGAPPKWYNIVLLVLFFVVLFVVGMFWIGPW